MFRTKSSFSCIYNTIDSDVLIIEHIYSGKRICLVISQLWDQSPP